MNMSSRNPLKLSEQSQTQFSNIMSNLQNSDETTVLQALKNLRHQIIGHDCLKEYFVESCGLCQNLLNILKSHHGVVIKQVAIIILGSLGHGGISNNKILKEICKCMVSDDSLIEASIRSLRTIYTKVDLSLNRSLIFEPQIFMVILDLIKNGHKRNSEFAAITLASCCDTEEKQNFLISNGVIDICTNEIEKKIPLEESSKITAFLDLLAALTRNNRMSCTLLIDHKIGNIMMLIINENITIEAKIFICIIITNVAAMCQDKLSKSINSIIIKFIIPTLKNILETDLRVKAARILTLLLTADENFQREACDPTTLKILNNMLNVGIESGAVFELEASLLAIASMTSQIEECREKVIETKCLEKIVIAMKIENVSIKKAACQCIKSLSRSVKTLRTSLVDCDVVYPLLNLIKDQCKDVRKAACAAICNLVLDFSPMKKTVIDGGGVEALVKLMDDDDESKCNAIWALKNLVFLAESDLKKHVMTIVGFENIIEILKNENETIVLQTQALNLIRNIACENDRDIVLVLENIGQEQLIKILESKIDNPNNCILEQTCYVIANICTCTTMNSKKAIISSRKIISCLCKILEFGNPAAQQAAIWCVINLTWPDDLGSRDRVKLLRRKGIEKKLEMLRSRSPPILAEQLKTALDNIRALDAQN